MSCLSKEAVIQLRTTQLNFIAVLVKPFLFLSNFVPSHGICLIMNATVASCSVAIRLRTDRTWWYYYSHRRDFQRVHSCDVGLLSWSNTIIILEVPFAVTAATKTVTSIKHQLKKIDAANKCLPVRWFVSLVQIYGQRNGGKPSMVLTLIEL